MKKAFIIFLWFSLVSLGVNAEKVIIGADHWCPYNCEPDGPLPGYMVEVTRRAFELHTEKQYDVEYRVLPWSRAIMYAKNGKISGIIGAVASEAEGLEITEQPMGLTRSVFFTHSDSSWTFTGVGALRQQKKRIGIIKDYEYSPEFTEYTAQNEDQLYVVFGEDPLPDLIRLLSLKRLDAIIEDESVFYYMLKDLKRPKELFRPAGATGQPEALYVAFKNPEYAAILNAGITRLRSSGELEQILQKYNLSDWAPPTSP